MSLLCGDAAIAAFAVYDPGRHAGLAQSCGDSAVAIQILQIFMYGAAYEPWIVTAKLDDELVDAVAWAVGSHSPQHRWP